MPAKQELPSIIERSSQKAQRTWSKAHDSAVDEYGDGERAHRTAYAALKHSFEKKGDRWVAKDEKGPSDPQAAKGARRPGRERARPTAASTLAATRSRSCTTGRKRSASADVRG